MALQLCRNNLLIHHTVRSLLRPTIFISRIHRLHASEPEKRKYNFLHRYVFYYIKNYDKILEKRFPSAMGVYRLFKLGVSEFFKEVKEYLKIMRKLNACDRDYKILTRKEIELYSQMPKDIKKVTPVIVIATLPFTGYIIFPLIFYFPRYLLTAHFWNLQQKSQFSILDLRDRLLHNKPVFRHLQARMSNLVDHPLYEPWKNILGMLGSGTQPTTEQILECRDIFAEKPCRLACLSRNHQKHLLKMHGMSAGLFRRCSRLRRHAVLLLEMDKAILREGGVHNLTTEALRKACIIRGLNSANMPNEELVKWLSDWMDVSSCVDEDTLSLILHNPILLAYNEQNNWTLIYSDKI